MPCWNYQNQQRCAVSRIYSRNLIDGSLLPPGEGQDEGINIKAVITPLSPALSLRERE
jgi:hypothetical protein